MILDGIKNRIEKVLSEDRAVREYHKDRDWKVLFGFTLISAAALSLMSILNVIQHSYSMLTLTACGSTVLMFACVLAAANKNTTALRICDCVVTGFLFAVFTFIGGNDGFAALWSVLIPLLGMTVVGMREGFAASFAFLVFLVILFYTPLNALMPYHYSDMFLLRFPFLYFISCVMGTWVSIVLCKSQYIAVSKTKELEEIYTIDTMTQMSNRNGFNLMMETVKRMLPATVGIVYADVNGLHELNNAKSHDAGDELLKNVAKTMNDCFPTEHCFRMGGDEFLAICLNIAKDDFISFTEIFNERIKEQGYMVSTGAMHSRVMDMEELSQLIKQADNVMLENKREFHDKHPELDRRVR